MHGSAILHSGGNLARNPPLALEFELQRTSFISFDRSGAQSVGESESGRHREPLASVGKNRFRRLFFCEQIDLQRTGITPAQAVPQAVIFEQVAEKSGRRSVFAGALLGVDDKR